jgi:hypothetical protein
VSFWNSHEEMWKQLAGELKGQFVEPGAWWKRGRVEAQWKTWTITMDKYVVSTGKVTQVFTRLRAPYVNADGFRFRIYRKSIFSGIGKSLGLVQDIEIGEEFFDGQFVIQGNNEDRIRAMLSRVELRKLIEAQPDICFEVKDDEGWFGARFPEGVDELHFLAHGVVTDLEQLHGLYKLFAEVLDYLCSVGSAYAQEPGVKLV